VALESATMAQGPLSGDRLRLIFDEAWSIPVRAHFVVYPPRHAQRPEVAQFLDWLKKQAAAADARGRARRSASVQRVGAGRAPRRG